MNVIVSGLTGLLGGCRVNNVGRINRLEVTMCDMYAYTGLSRSIMNGLEG